MLGETKHKAKFCNTKTVYKNQEFYFNAHLDEERVREKRKLLIFMIYIVTIANGCDKL